LISRIASLNGFNKPGIALENSGVRARAGPLADSPKVEEEVTVCGRRVVARDDWVPREPVMVDGMVIVVDGATLGGAIGGKTNGRDVGRKQTGVGVLKRVSLGISHCSRETEKMSISVRHC
jgi:hypothetical protein